MSSDRRRAARVEILGRVHGHAVSLDAPVVVREISIGGMAIETSFAFPIGEVHEFRLTLGDGAHVLLQGQVRHCRPLPAPPETPMFLTGFQFVDEDASALVDTLNPKASP